MPALGSSAGVSQAAERRRRRRRHRPSKSVRRRSRKPPRSRVSTPTAILGGRGVRRTQRAARHARRTARRRVTRAFRRAVGTRGTARTGATPLSRVQRPVTGLPARAQRRATRALASSRPTLSASNLRSDIVGAISALGGDPSEVGLAPATPSSISPKSRAPSREDLEAAALLAPLPAAKAALVARALLRGGSGLKTAERVVRTAKVAEKARKGRKATIAAEQVAAKTRTARTKATAKGMGRSARAKLGKVERQARRAKRQDRAVRTVTSPVGAAAVSAPGDLGDIPRAFIEGTITANPKKSLQTTARTIPASLGFLADVGAGIGATGVRATRAGLGAAGLPGGADYEGGEITDPIEGVASQVPEIAKSLAPLVSGDTEQVREATESEIGYAFAPLLPRGAVSGPVRAVGRGTRAAARRGFEAVDRGGRLSGQVSPVREAVQRVTGGGTRKRVATQFSREVEPARYEAARREREIDKAIGRRTRGTPVRDLIGVLADYGIARKGAPEQLRMVRETIERTGGEGVPEGFALPVDAVTTSRALQVAERNPEVLRSDRLWNAVEAYKAGAREIETSPVAKHREQARVLDVQPPEARVPMHARKFTKAETRGEAWADYEGNKKRINTLRRDALKAEARGAREQASTLRGEAKVLANRNKNLHATLKPYTHPDVTPSPQLKSMGWDGALAQEFLDEVRVRAGRHGFAEPAWTRHADLRHVLDGEIPVRQHGKPTGTQHIKTGASEAADMVDRSYDALTRGSIYFPRMRNAVARFTRSFLESEARPVRIDDKARTVLTRDQWNRAVREGEVDPREFVLLPANQWGNAVKQADFDLRGFHTDVAKRVLGEVADLGEARGTRYVVVSREAAREFADQIDPGGKGLETALSGAGMVGQRAILGFSPAWAMMQIGAEGLQMLAATSSPRRLGRAATALSRLRRQYPKEYEALVGTAGESVMSFQQPHVHRVRMDGGTQGQFSRAHKAISRTALGEAMYDLTTGQLLGKFDKFKGGKYRSVVLAAQVDKSLNSLLGGLQGALRVERHVADQLKGKPLHEQLAMLARDPKLRKTLNQHTKYLEDVMGNWNTFTRYEKKFAPLAIFYPYVRMSFRWTLLTYPSRHPAKAQMLYLAGQQHAEDLEKLLGAPPDWIHYGDPIIYDKGAKRGAVAILPIGQRISPGLNAFMESVGTGNVAGIVRGANPFIGTAFYGISGIDPLSGEQEATTVAEHGLLALNQLLAMPAPSRALGFNKVGEGELSPVAKKFREIDPQRQIRSNVFPYLPQSVKQARQYNDLSRLLDDAFGGYEITVPETERQKAARSEYEQRFPSPEESDSSANPWLDSESSGSNPWLDSEDSGSSSNPWLDEGSSTSNPWLK